VAEASCEGAQSVRNRWRAQVKEPGVPRRSFFKRRTLREAVVKPDGRNKAVPLYVDRNARDTVAVALKIGTFFGLCSAPVLITMSRRDTLETDCGKPMIPRDAEHRPTYDRLLRFKRAASLDLKKTKIAASLRLDGHVMTQGTFICQSHNLALSLLALLWRMRRLGVPWDLHHTHGAPCYRVDLAICSMLPEQLRGWCLRSSRHRSRGHRGLGSLLAAMLHCSFTSHRGVAALLPAYHSESILPARRGRYSVARQLATREEIIRNKQRLAGRASIEPERLGVSFFCAMRSLINHILC
jgi:hypothetical protein